jgi:mannitol-1-/sugar-/sorbitol-6-phosphatase
MALSVSSSPVVLHCQGILFDMDGILISSLASVERSWTKWANLRGLDPAHVLSVIHGRRAVESAAELRPDLDPGAELKLIEEIECADGDGIEILPGVKELLSALPAHRWTVVTSATEKLARTRLALIGLPLPERLITAGSVPQGKPHPAPYLEGAKLLGFAPEACVVFEDSASGVLAGEAAGCTVIGTTFSHTPEELAAAHYLVRDLTQIAVETSAAGLELTLRL